VHIAVNDPVQDVRFLAGGNTNKDTGLPGSFATRGGAYLARPARGRDRGASGGPHDVEGEPSRRGGNQFDIQTAVR
jgi:hypothetical protein